MNALRLVVLICLFVLSVPLQASAEKLCSDSKKEWTCFGQIEVKVDATNDQRMTNTRAKMVFFKNNEETMQLSKNDINFQQLFVPNKMLLYAGIPKTANVKEEVEKLQFESSLLISLPLEVLNAAYPSGPESIGDGYSTKTIGDSQATSTMTFNNSPTTITTIRTNLQHINFTIVSGPITLSGSWDSQLAEPYPDDFDLTGWTHTGAATVNSLSDARYAIPRLRSK